MAGKSGNLSGVWKSIGVWCTNHDDPVPLIIRQNEAYVKTPFYACKNDTCANRVNLDDYQDIVLKFLDVMQEYGTGSLLNYSFKFKGHRHAYVVTVIKYAPEDIRLGIKNTTILGL